MYSIYDKYKPVPGEEKALSISLHQDIARARRNLKHVASIRSGKQEKKLKDISDSTLTSAILWLGHAMVCRIIKRSDGGQDVLDGFNKEYMRRENGHR